MFTGIVEASVPVRSWERVGSGGRLALPAPERTLADAWGASPGESICVSGACLTVAELVDPPHGGGGGGGGGHPDMHFELSAETLARTWFTELAPGRVVNLERSLRLGDRLGGHLVSGHVDGAGHLVEARDVGDAGRELVFEVDPGLERFLVEKGSITVDGVSLTVVEPVGRRFRVAAIPATLELTSLGSAAPGQRVNLEADQVGKWIEKLFPGARP